MSWKVNLKPVIFNIFSRILSLVREIHISVQISASNPHNIVLMKSALT